MQPGPHVEEMEAAIRLDGEGLRALLSGDTAGGRERLLEAAERYRASWELAPPRSYGRLVGMLKAAVIAGDAAGSAAYAREAVPEADSPPSSYVRALAARDGEAYTAAVRAIVSDFEGRDEHLTGVPVADTALMLETLAEPRGLA